MTSAPQTARPSNRPSDFKQFMNNLDQITPKKDLLKRRVNSTIRMKTADQTPLKEYPSIHRELSGSVGRAGTVGQVGGFLTSY